MWHSLILACFAGAIILIIKAIRASQDQPDVELNDYDQGPEDQSALTAAATTGGDVPDGRTSAAGLIFPVPGGRITRGFGTVRAAYGSGSTYHGAVDIPAKEGTAIFAVADGVVDYVTQYAYNCKDRSDCKSCGNGLWIKHNTQQMGEFRSGHCHMSALFVSKGQPVAQGQTIGIVGSTGNSTTAHLHFSLEQRMDGKWKAVDPQPYLPA